MAESDRRDELQRYPPEKARQGHVVLRTRTRRIIFVAGLVALAVVAIALPAVFAS
jgi:hypothetical protein